MDRRARPHGLAATAGRRLAGFGRGRYRVLEADRRDRLRVQTDVRRATEVAIAAEVLNRMLDLGRPEYVRLA